MRVLALDISTRSGYAVLEGEKNSIPKLVEHGVVENQKTAFEYGGYPLSYLFAAEDVVARLMEIVVRVRPNTIVIEETNLGKNRYSQKLLEFLHCSFLRKYHTLFIEGHHHVGWTPQLAYISSSQWRHTLNLTMTAADKKNNARLSKAKRIAAETGKKLDKKSLGIKGKIGKKHMSVRYVNDTFAQNFKMKDNDITDAICLGTAFLNGALICDGVV